MFDAAAHEQEHGIEVQLPLLARVAPRARVAAIAIGRADLGQCRQIAAGLAAVVRSMPRPPLLVISSDMNHFADDATTRRLDALALAAVIRRAKTGHSSAPKTGHHVGGTRWKNRLIRFCWQGA